ncbi:hypothetical protein ABT144_33810 [Streptomyces sp. NPDC002039]|uniref:hypothetical protein n=1 Tax=Streptomyces sp. NPDC002039 TaxID=3154660 RepID=UPI00331A989A
MPLSKPRTPSSHRARSTRRHAGMVAAAAAGKRALRRPPLLSAAGGPHPGAITLAALAALAALVVMAQAGALTDFWNFLDFGAGVLSLVSLSSTVLWGLAATDRTLFSSGHRLVAQGVHRGLAVAGLGFLGLHIWVKIAKSQTVAASAVVPFADPVQPLRVGLGTLAGYLFIAVAVSGAVRSAFATKGRSMWWRALHMGAYPAWGASLVHGLKAGRPASGWVTVAYGLCLAGVAAVLVIRLRRRLRSLPARPPGGTPTSPKGPKVPEQAPPRNPGPFVSRPAEWAASRLTARLARQSDERPEPEARPDWGQESAPRGAESAPAQPYAQPYAQSSPPPYAEPYAQRSYAGQGAGREPRPGPAPDTLLIQRGAAGPVTAAWPESPPEPEYPQYGTVFIPSQAQVTTERPGGPFDGSRGRQ